MDATLRELERALETDPKLETVQAFVSAARARALESFCLDQLTKGRDGPLSRTLGLRERYREPTPFRIRGAASVPCQWPESAVGGERLIRV